MRARLETRTYARVSAQPPRAPVDMHCVKGKTPKSLRALAAALGSAALGVLLLHIYLRRYERELAGGTPRPIVMVTRDLVLGATLRGDQLATRMLPEAYLEDRHVLAEDLERVLGARLSTALPSGSALLWSDLDAAPDPSALARLVRPGLRAYALSEHEVSFDGLLRPGDRVDVLFAAAERSHPSSVVLENVLVLTAGADLGSEAEGSSLGAGPVTLSVTQQQAAKLAEVEGQGRIRLLLRNPEDLAISDGAETSLVERGP